MQLLLLLVVLLLLLFPLLQLVVTLPLLLLLLMRWVSRCLALPQGLKPYSRSKAAQSLN